ncbi:SDR family NAD(P)-dependent oxidoreductase [Vallitalea pronyensis]|uniref:SDR family NAD(P)-dependent oxidoreductase n=1 Tax=Vallitalea pronyensis TaxID=1348613 RepID=A0A8J8MPR3_9FIRM|nr:SDR family NAD(P)-dependent oxidoreductase [Vallitalea pronyensis]QUI25374.1 SDR family NAD(P)-dependent oxidoreductase [Vallitalea pronyensis]
MKNLGGKTALITGASRGIGQQIAIGLAMVGCDVIIHASRMENLNETEALLMDYGIHVYKIAADLSHPVMVQNMLEQMDEQYPQVDIIYNNAAMSCKPQDHYQLDRQLMDKIMEVNVYSLITICNHYLPKMQEQRYGRIINFTSGINRQPALEPYAISKGAVDKYTKDMAVLLEGSNVLMNLITPGWVRTAMGGSEATLDVGDVLPGVLVPALLEEGGPCGTLFNVPAYVGLTIDAVMQETEHAFPWIMPDKKPLHRPLSAAINRLYDVYGKRGDNENEFYSIFKYTKVTGIGNQAGITRRDPSKVLRINGKYYVWYTLRHTKPPKWNNGDDETPSSDWDLSDIGYAVSDDGIHWEEKGIAVARPPKGTVGDRSLATPDVMVAEGKYYLIYQAYTGYYWEESTKYRDAIIAAYPEQDGSSYHWDFCCASMAWADSPEGPWTRLDKPVIDRGNVHEWDNTCIHDPYLIKFNGKYCLYYKSDSHIINDNCLKTSQQGVAFADSPMGPYTKSAYNPVLISGHETFVYPYKDGVVAIATFDGPEKNTCQFSKDGVNFEIKGHLGLIPTAAGPFNPDAFADNGDAQGITWGMCHMRKADGSGFYLARFDCDLSQKNLHPELKKDRFIMNETTYWQPYAETDVNMVNKFQADMKAVDVDTI